MRSIFPMRKKIFSNYSILFLLAGNLYCIWYYADHPGDFASIVWIYWFQSVTIGLFNFIDLLTVKNYSSEDLKLNGESVTDNNKGCTAWFFLFHFGTFHLVYAVFLLVKFSILSVDKMIFLVAVAVFFMESIINFMRQKQIERTMTVNIGTMFILPYFRIIPMHLMILGPAFLGWKPSMIFLVLKMIADIISFLLYQHIYGKNKTIDNTE
ncbi:MAG: hypothetical protein IPP96_10490 [Chitinophagaceae bacterium]|nr:hypothetical protein [Chitinophagaceae bacterium]